MPTPAAAQFEDGVFEALRTVYSKSGQDANIAGLDFEFIDGKAAKYAEERGAELIGGSSEKWSVTQTTKDAANELLQQATNEGWSYQKLSDALDEAGLFSDARADTIARTEIAMAQNYGQCETWQESGITHVIVLDGDCDDCREVDGEEWTIEEALEDPLGHPNCVRSFIPVVN